MQKENQKKSILGFNIKQAFPPDFKELSQFFLSYNGLFLLIAIAIPTVVFKVFFVEVLNTFLVNPLFATIQKSLQLDFLFFITVLLILIDFISKFQRGFIESKARFSICFVLVFVYLAFRCSFIQDWHFISLFLFKSVKYFDIFILLFLNSFYFWWKNFIIVKQEERSTFLTDSPIKNETEDELNRKDFAHSIAQKILDIKYIEQALAIGITGRWGNGKSSFLRLIENELIDKKKGKKLTIVNFNPWQLNSSTSLVDEFFTMLRGKLKKYNANLSTQFSSYTQKLTSINQNLLTNFIEITASSLEGEKNLMEVFSEINGAIERLDRKLIVFIDDIDRLEKNEVLEVIRLIRNTANFRNTIFVAAFDRNYILAALKEVNFYQAESYLEKIFQLEITLPVFEKELNKKYLKRVLLEKFQTEAETINFYFRSNKESEDSEMIDLLKSRRDIIRFVNSLLLVYQQLKGEVFFIDLLNLEIIRLKFPVFYDFLAEAPKQWFKIEGEQSNLERYVLIEEPLENASAKYDEPSIINYLKKEEIQKEFFIDQKSIMFISDWLKETFNKKTTEFNVPGLQTTNHLSINRPNHFLKYFAYRLLNSNFSEVRFSTIRGENQIAINIQFGNWMHSKWKSGLINRLEIFKSKKEFSSYLDCEKLITAIFHIGKYEGHKSFLEMSNFPGFGGGLVDIVDAFTFWGQAVERDSRITKEDSLKQLVLTNLEKAVFPYNFELFYLLKSAKSKHFFESLLFIEEKDKILLSYMERGIHKVLEDKNGFYDNNLWTILMTFTYEDSLELQNRPHFQKAIKIFKEFLKKHDPIGFFIQHLSDSQSRTSNRETSFRRGEQYILESHNLFPIFQDVEDLKAFYQKIKLKEYKIQLKEIIQFFESVQTEKTSSSFRPSIQENFQHLYQYQLNQKIQFFEEFLNKMRPYQKGIFPISDSVNVYSHLLAIQEIIESSFISEILLEKGKAILTYFNQKKTFFKNHFAKIDAPNESTRSEITTLIGGMNQHLTILIELLRKEKNSLTLNKKSK